MAKDKYLDFYTNVDKNALTARNKVLFHFNEQFKRKYYYTLLNVLIGYNFLLRNANKLII